MVNSKYSDYSHNVIRSLEATSKIYKEVSTDRDLNEIREMFYKYFMYFMKL